MSGSEVEDETSFVASKLSFRDSLSILGHSPLVNTTEGSTAFSIHPVVHSRSFYNILDPKTKELLCEKAIRMVMDTIPHAGDTDIMLKAERLLPHARMIASRQRKLPNMKNVEEEVFRITNFMSDWESSQAVEVLYVRALRGYEEALGARHESTLNTVNNLGLLYEEQGKPKEAEEMYVRALRGYEEALGAKHTSTLHTVYNLVNLYRDNGEVSKARQMYARAVEGYRRVKGDHDADIEYLREQLSL